MPDFLAGNLADYCLCSQPSMVTRNWLCPHFRRNMGMAQAFDPSVNRDWHRIFCDHCAYDPVLNAGSNAGGLYAHCCI